jgi:hypothetical protein
MMYISGSYKLDNIWKGWPVGVTGVIIHILKMILILLWGNVCDNNTSLCILMISVCQHHEMLQYWIVWITVRKDSLGNLVRQEVSKYSMHMSNSALLILFTPPCFPTWLSTILPEKKSCQGGISRQVEFQSQSAFLAPLESEWSVQSYRHPGKGEAGNRMSKHLVQAGNGGDVESEWWARWQASHRVGEDENGEFDVKNKTHAHHTLIQT